MINYSGDKKKYIELFPKIIYLFMHEIWYKNCFIFIFLHKIIINFD